MMQTLSLKKNSEFLRLYKKGRFYAGTYMVIYVQNNHLECKRLGITVSSKVGKSVKRNRIKRLIKESYRLLEEHVISGVDIVFVARVVEKGYTFNEIKREMKFLLRKMGILHIKENRNE